MMWFLLFAMIGSNLTQLEGPYKTREECVQHEYFSPRWCLAGCVQVNQLPKAVTDLTHEQTNINAAGAYCSDHQIGE